MDSETFKKYVSGQHSIYHGNALDVLPTLADNSIDLIFADPPYNIGKRFTNFIDKWPTDEAYAEWCQKWLDLCIQKLTPTGSLYVMSSTQSMPYLDLYLRKKLTILSRIIWHYDSSGVQAKNYFGSLYEPILYCVKNPKSYTFNAAEILVEAKTGAKRKLIDYRKKTPTVYNAQKVPGNAWYFPRVRYRMAEYENHPAQKPEVLLKRIIAASSNPGDTVLDPFAGTFTTCAVAKKMNRASIGIDLQEEYIKIGLRRVGIQATHNGEVLQPPQKNFQPKNPLHNTNQLKLDGIE
jgi:site-specific DNA-methyltransferase (adenine-specific)